MKGNRLDRAYHYTPAGRRFCRRFSEKDRCPCCSSLSRLFTGLFSAIRLGHFSGQFIEWRMFQMGQARLLIRLG
jgi:hypothetical protein